MKKDFKDYKLNKPVLLVTWNRLDYLKEVFKQVKLAKPPKLYIASDGARENNSDDVQKINEVRKYLLDNIDWKCEIKTRFLEKNLGGCGLGVSGAITWFFENEEMGIILEDDCVPSPSFFQYCEELLDKYKDDKRIWSITGDAPIETNIKETYFFSKIPHCWGWASWADRWAKFKFDLDSYDEKNIKKFSKNRKVREYWKTILRKMKNHEIDSWDYQWTLWAVSNNGMCAVAAKPLVSNIGIDGVHYTNAEKDNNLNKTLVVIDKIVHPKEIKFNKVFIERIYREHYRIYKKENTKFTQKIFSVKNQRNGDKIHKVVTILGVKMKFKKRNVR